MSWKQCFLREKARRTSDDDGRASVEHELIEPRLLLNTHRTRLDALRLESGYGAEQYERLIGAVLQQFSEWVHFLPATRADNHSESGGLLRLCVETACLAFRRADGKFLAGPNATDVRNRDRDRVWRYAALLGGLLRPVGRCVTHVSVSSLDAPMIWNALQEPLWFWMRRVEARQISIRWRSGVDDLPTQPASTWLAARLLPASTLSYLQSADESLPQVLLTLINAGRAGRIGEIVEEAYQAAVDQDLNRRGNAEGALQVGVQVEHRLLEALRALCREKWTLNTPGGRLWFTDSGVYLVWKAAANDILVRMRAEGIGGVPRDAETLAELLVAHGVFATNPQVQTGLKHYFKLIPQMRGLPKQGLEVVKIADTERLGLQLHGVDQVTAELVGPQPIKLSARAEVSAPQALELPLTVPAAEPSVGVTTVEDAPSVQPSVSPSSERTAVPAATKSTASMERLRRFGAPGAVLQRLAEQLQGTSSNVSVVRVAEGVALGFPDAIEAVCPNPQEFLDACEAQGLLVPETAGTRRFVRSRAADRTDLPPRYVVLAARVARYLSLPGDSR